MTEPRDELSSPPSPSAREPQKIGFGPRFRALVVDIMLAMVAYTLGHGLTGLLLGMGMGEPEIGTFQPMAADARMVAGDTLFLLVFLSEAVFGRTPGKRLTGLRIGTDTGQAAPSTVLALRTLLKSAWPLGILLGDSLFWLGNSASGQVILYTTSLAGVVFLLGCLGAFGQGGKTLHDLVAGTAVYRSRELD